MTLSAVLFDLDGTLLDRTTSLQLFLKSQHARLIAPVSTCTFDAYQTLFLTFDQNGLVWKDVVYQKLITYFQFEGVTATELLQDYLSSFASSSVLFPQTLELLQRLSHTYRLGLITNGRSDLQRSVIAHHQLQTFFDPILISEEVGLVKPDPALFLRPVQDWGLTPEQVLFIGDRIIHCTISKEQKRLA